MTDAARNGFVEVIREAGTTRRPSTRVEWKKGAIDPCADETVLDRSWSNPQHPHFAIVKGL
jgi:hypothetical protein